MPAYRTPLPAILAAMLETAINRVLALDDETPARLQHLDGRMLQLDLEGVSISLFFRIYSYACSCEHRYV